ncbi:MAG: SpoIVB peptidase [Clostridia bacterium]|nr:SpoIVB peptidase [Clostridia bacterium]MBQ8637478.1 SpoIVB peptidase [Clostridia bacterium]
MKKNICRALCAILPISVVTVAYISTPSKITLTENALYSAYPNGLVRLSSDNGAVINTASVGVQNVTAELFGTVPIKTVEVSVVPEQYVYASGEVIGVRIYADGVMVVGVETISGARIAGIKKGDLIKKINGIPADSTEQISKVLSSQKVNTLTICRGGEVFDLTVRGQMGEKGYIVGMWVRDSAAGIGTLTYTTDDYSFGALGHAICDSDTELVVPLGHGSLSPCRVTSVKAGESGEPGELMGVIGGEVIGAVHTNSDLGLYGTLSSEAKGIKLPIATEFLVKEGDAEILSDVDGTGVKAYKIRIEQISRSNSKTNKSMSLRVTDENLLSITGGIVQGMSGSPIIQNGRIVGAVTHVFVNDPTRGYGIFIENMLGEDK